MRRMAEAWRAGMPLRGWMFQAALALLAAASLAFIWVMASRLYPVIHSGNKVFSDFFAHWSYGGFVVAHPGPAIYDDEAMFAFQRGLFDGRLKLLPFVYPPPYLFIVAPLAAFDIGTAAVLWSAVSLAAFVVATHLGRWRGWTVALALLAPSTTMCLAYGQNALLLAAALVGGLLLLPARPVWGGVLLALVCTKPHLAILLPVALLAGRQWQAIAAALATGLVLIAASTLWIGPQAWLDWFQAIPGQADSAANWISAYRQPTVTAALSLLGAARGTALAAQAVVAMLVAVGVAVAWRRGPTPAAAASVLAGTLLATPYGFVYDLPVATAAVILLAEGRTRLSWPEVAIMAAALLLPMVLHLTSRFFWTGPATLAALFGLCLVAAYRKQKESFLYQPPY